MKLTRTDWLVFLAVCLVSLAIVLIIVDIYHLKTSGGQCASSPLTYGVKELEKANDDTVRCTCYFGRGGSILVTKEGITNGFG